MSITGTQMRKALDTLLGAKPKPKKPLKIETPPPPKEVEEDVLTWENMEIEEARKEADAMPIDEQIRALEEADEYAGVLESAQQAFSMTKQVYGAPQIPRTVLNPTPLKQAIGPAWDNLVHFSDDAMEEMAMIVQEQGRGRQFLTSITDGDVGVISRSLPKEKLQDPEILGEHLATYDYDRGFPFVPSLAAEMESNGDILIKGLDDMDASGWNSLILLSGNRVQEGVNRYFPLALRFDKPLFETNGGTGRVFFINEEGVKTQLVGVNTTQIKNTAPPKSLSYDKPDWVEQPIKDDADAAERVALLFDENTGQTGLSIFARGGQQQDHLKLKNLMWEQHANTDRVDNIKLQSDFTKSRASFYPRDDSDEPFLVNWFTGQDNDLRALLDYTKDSPYKARLVDPKAAKDHPIILSRGVQGAQFVDAKGTLQPLATMDSRIAREFGVHIGSMTQAEYIALRGAVPDSMRRTRASGEVTTFGEEYRLIQQEGDRIVKKLIHPSEDLTVLWDEFITDIIASTGWGQRTEVQGYVDDLQMLHRPSFTSISNRAYDLLTSEQYKKLYRGLLRGMPPAASAASLSVSKTYLSALKGNADLDFFVTNAKRPLLLWDLQGFQATRIARQLLDKPEFMDDFDDIQEALSLSEDAFFNADQQFSATANRMLRDVIERHGYDHIAYTNLVEFAGTPSFIFWKKDSIRPIYSFGVDQQSLKMLAGPLVAVAVAHQLQGQVEEVPTEEEGAEVAPTKMSPGFYSREDGTFFEITEEGTVVEHGS